MNPSYSAANLLYRLNINDQDQEAWIEFVRQYGNTIYGWCLKRRLADADAQDVTQEVLIKVSKRLKTFKYDPQQSFLGWLRRITENAVIDFLRSKTVNFLRRANSIDSLNHEPVDKASWNSFSSNDDMELMELALARVKRRVTGNRWHSWHLLTYSRMSGKEVAAKLGIGVGTVYANKNQIQNSIRKEIECLTQTTV